MPFLNGISDDQKTPGLFYFEYVNIYGDIVQTRYKLNPSYEGKMLLFAQTDPYNNIRNYFTLIY